MTATASPRQELRDAFYAARDEYRENPTLENAKDADAALRAWLKALGEL